MVRGKRSVANSSTLSGWFKSSYSGGSQGDCLEAARGYAGIPVRDSKTSSGPAIVFSASGWTSFLAAVKDDRFTV
ncbi:DUF397 domain-containing protein [Streptomyces sp. NPDC059818]|uniref:DUF397 domain-containing protein n=1 Tax=Streptomyces sp. NPDC059818 TaxID=3346962 RepID=UPI0036562C4D